MCVLFEFHCPTFIVTYEIKRKRKKSRKNLSNCRTVCEALLNVRVELSLAIGKQITQYI